MRVLAVVILLMLSGCGYSSRDNEVIGQVKRVIKRTPIFCNDYTDVDISMGIMKNGTGSVSKEDLFLTVADESLVKKLKDLAESGEPVKVTYGVKRFTWCWEDHILTDIQPAK